MYRKEAKKELISLGKSEEKKIVEDIFFRVVSNIAGFILGFRQDVSFLMI